MPSKALALIDLLGFSNMISKDADTARHILNDFYNITYDLIRAEPNIQGKLFSDSLLVYSENRECLVNTCCELYRQCLHKNSEYRFSKDNFFLLPRGGISIGMIEIQDRIEPPNLTKDFIVSPALVHSAAIEKSIKGSRLFIAVKVNSNEEKEILWNEEIETLLYPDNTFVLWENYQYRDALWFLDRGKSLNGQKTEVRNLIGIASALLLAAGNEKNIEQQAGTLRIGLLSYARFLSSDPTDTLLNEIIELFSEEKYWKVWLAIFEMVLRRGDSVSDDIRQEIMEFYSTVNLTPGWIKVLQEINRPGNEFLLSLMQRYIR